MRWTHLICKAAYSVDVACLSQTSGTVILERLKELRRHEGHIADRSTSARAERHCRVVEAHMFETREKKLARGVDDEALHPDGPMDQVLRVEVSDNFHSLTEL